MTKAKMIRISNLEIDKEISYYFIKINTIVV